MTPPLSSLWPQICVECVTQALATQLVLTLPGPLSDAGRQELAAIWAELQEFGGRIEGLPLTEIRARLTAFEQRILAVVRDDPATTDVPEPARATPNGTAGPERSGATGGVAEPGGTAAPTGASISSSPAPTAEPTGTGTPAPGSDSATSAPAATSAAAESTGPAEPEGGTG